MLLGHTKMVWHWEFSGSGLDFWVWIFIVWA